MTVPDTQRVAEKVSRCAVSTITGAAGACCSASSASDITGDKQLSKQVIWAIRV
jgi:hypothetical protein